ncbi:MAG: glycosyltransferase [Actinomycetota bacterium]|nr:glycosyltransferase [Actinomycetota bacterium]
MTPRKRVEFPERTKVSLVSTVHDAGTEIGEFLHSVAAQSRAPDEVIVVDGGSGDGTVEVLRAASGITLIEETGANIARGRNLGVRAAAHDVIAVSDGDCVLEPDWLERLMEPIERGADVSMGSYRPNVHGFLDACLAAVAVPEPSELREDRFMPSSRSVAFRRAAFEAAGGYPEWLDIGEDMYLDLRWRELGVDMRLAPDAVALWRPRPTLAEHARQYARYARGDAVAGMHPRRHAIRFAVYAGLVVAVASRRRSLLGLAAVAGAAYAARPVMRAARLLEDPTQRAAAIAFVPAVMALTDGAKMAGYLSGLTRRRR